MNTIKENNYRFEVCANSVASCLEAQKGGAQRVELCAGIPEGGTTPSYGTLVTARKLITIGMHVIIRPRSGDFLYDSHELEIMKQDIRIAQQAGADGVVLGCLTPEGDVDVQAMQQLIKVAEKMSITFHRAFDVCRNPEQALEQLIALGCNRVLTSGQEANAEQGIPLLKKLHEKANGRIIILAGCGVNANNIKRIAAETDIHEFHFSARESVAGGMLFKNSKVSMGGKVFIDEYGTEVTRAEKVRQTIDALL